MSKVWMTFALSILVAGLAYPQSWPSVAQSHSLGAPNLMDNTMAGTGQDFLSTFLSGRVTLEEGAPIEQSVLIVANCSGSALPLGYTDSRGYFNLQMKLPAGGGRDRLH